MKRTLSLFLCVCLCLTLFAGLTLSAHAFAPVQIVIDGYEFDPVNGGDRSTFGGGMITVEITSTQIRVGLNNCQIGGSAPCSGHDDPAATPKDMGFYVRADRNVLLELSGENEIMSNFTIEQFGPYGGKLEGGEITVASVPGGSGKLTVNGEAFFYSYLTLIRDAQFEVTGTNTNCRNAMYVWGSLQIGEPSLKGPSGYEPGLCINTSRPVGLYAETLQVYGGTSCIQADTVGMYLDNNQCAPYTFCLYGGGLNLSGGQAAALLRLWSGELSLRTTEFGQGYGEINDVPACASSAYPVGTGGFKFHSWGSVNPMVLSGDYDDFNSSEYPFTCTAAKDLSFGLKGGMNEYCYVTFHAAPYGQIDATDGMICAYAPGSKLGALPVPSNKSFHTPGAKFDNMFFLCWIQDNDPMMPVSASTVINENMELYAYFVEGQSGMSFKDVKESDWFYEAAGYCYGQGLIAGTGDGSTFSPTVNCSRAMIVSILYRLHGSPEVYGSNTFSDVKNGQWYTDAVIWASENGIVAGDGKGHFMPNNDVTREQLALIMMKYATYIARMNPTASVGLNAFPDSGKVASWAVNAVRWAVAMALLSGKPQNGKNYLDPQGTATRAEFASILMRFIRAFDGDRAFYASDLDWFCVFIPETWNGHIRCEHTTTDLGEWITFYLVDQELAVPGSGRLFSLLFTPVAKGMEYTNLPKWQYLGYMQTVAVGSGTTEMRFNVVLDLPTDVQSGMAADPMENQILIDLYNAMFARRADALMIYGLNGLEFATGVG